MKDVPAAIILLVLALTFAVFVTGGSFRSWADTASSTDFMVKDGFIGIFGGYASSTDFQVAGGGSAITNGDATGTGFGNDTGPDNFDDFAPASQAWRWYGDANDETPTSSLAAQDVSPSNIANGQVIKLRMTIKETSGLAGEGNVKFRLQFSSASDFSSGVGTVAETASCNATSTWCYATSTGSNDNAVITTKLLSDADACSGGVGNGCGTHNTSGISTSSASQTAGAATEYEFTIEAPGAAAGNTYFFRAVNAADGAPVPLNATSSYPSLVTQGATLTFSVAGLAQGVATNGVTTTITTSATGVPFGTLPLGTSVIGAQRLSVTTNAASGYELYAFDDSPLTNNVGQTLPPIPASNASPLPWASACTATSTACYGYHSGSSVLSGGSTRFAPNDSYAGFSTSSAEVGYASSPTTSSTVDMVYRAQVGTTQPDGTYSDNVVYVIAPTF